MYSITAPHIFHFFEAWMGHTLSDLASLSVMSRVFDGPNQLDVGKIQKFFLCKLQHEDF